MDADGERSALDTITSRVIGCAHTVGNVLGPGFLEKVYENALMVELRSVVNRVQCLNYLRATGLRIALLLNFGSPRVEVQRVVHRY